MQEKVSINGIASGKQAEEAYRALVDHSLQGLIIIQDMRIVFANRAMAEISGYSVEEMLSASSNILRDFVHPQDRETAWRLHEERLHEAPLPNRYAFRAVHKSGSALWLEIHTSRVEYQGRPAIQAACIDVTERHRAEQALRRSEMRNLALLNAIPDLMFRLSAGGVFLDCKPPRDDALSVSPSQFVGQHLKEVFPRGTAERLTRCIGRVLETGGVETLEYSLPGPYDQQCDFECRLVACAEQEVLAIVREVTDRRRAEYLRRLQRDLAVQLSSLSDLAEALHCCLEAAVTGSGMDCGVIHLVDEGAGCLVLAAHMGVSTEFVQQSGSHRLNSHRGRLVMAGHPIYSKYEDLEIPRGPIQRREGFRATGLVPILDDGDVIACLSVASHAREEVPPWSRTVLETIAAQLGSAIRRLKTEESLRRAEREKATILDVMSELVVYRGTDHRILWGNRAAAESVGKTPQGLVGRRCFELWQDRQEPCAGCPVDEMSRSGEPVEAELTDQWGKIWLLHAEPVKDRAGRVIGAVEMGLDITDRKRAEERLRARLRFGELITGISTDFVNLRADQIGEGIDRALTAVGSFADADRSFLFLLDDAGAEVSITHQWRAHSSDLEGMNVQGIPLSCFPWGVGRLREAGVLDIPKVWDLQGQEAEVKDLLQSMQVKSLLCVPVIMGGDLIAFLGLATVHHETSWSEDVQAVLKMVAEILANALERKRSAEALAERLAFETLLSSLSATFVNLPTTSIGVEIERGLARIGDSLGIERGVMAELTPDGDSVEVTYSWAADGLDRVPEDLGQGGRFAWAIERIRRGELIAFSRVEEAPPEAASEKEYCRQQGIKSIIVIPLSVGGSILGSISFSSIRTHRSWSDALVQRLRMVGEIFANALLRKRAEEALRDSEARLRSIIRAAPVGIGLVRDRVLLTVNEGICEMVGYAQEELVGHSARLLYVTEQDYEYVGQAKYRQIAERGTGTIETRWRRKDGQVIDVLLSSTPLDPADLSQGVTFTALDITARKKAEEELRNIFDLSLDLVCIADIGTATFTRINPAFSRTLGYIEQELTERSFLEFVHPEDVDMTRALLRDKLLAGEEVINFENRYRCKDGSYRWLNWTAHPVPEQGLSYAVAHDVTERRETEEALKRSDIRFRSLIGQTTDAVFCYEYDPPIPTDLPVAEQVRRFYDGVLVECNDVAARSYGAARATDVIGKPLNQLFHATPKGLDDFFRAFILARYRVVNAEASEVCPDGSKRYYVNNGHGIVEDGRLVRVWGAFRDVTEHRQAVVALGESERRYRELYEGSRDASAAVDLDGRIVECNSTFLDMLGYSHAEVRTRTYEDITPARWRAEEARILEEQVLRRGYSDVYEKEYIRKDGSVFPVELRTYVNRDDSGKVTGMWALIRDITERKRAELALRESESRFRELANLLPQTVFEADAAGRFTYANRAGLETFGYTEQEVADLTVVQVMAPKDRERVVMNFGKRMAGESFRDHEYTALTKDGRMFPVLLYSSPIVRDGQTTGLRGIVFDVTEHKRAERRLRELRDIIDRSPVLVFLWRVEPGRWPVEFVSENVVRSLGYTADDFVSGRVSWPGVTHPEDVPRLEAEVAQFLAEGRREWSQEYRLITRSGEVRWFTDENLALADETGSITHIQSIVIDTTERKHMEEALLESERKYRELYEGSRDGTATTDLTGRILQCNSVFADMLGYRSEELTQLTVWDFTPAEWMEPEKRVIDEQVHTRGYSDVFEKEYVRKDGSVFPVELRVYLTRDIVGNPVGTWAIVRDITERKQAELALRASEKNYREIFSAANESIFIHDPRTGQILDVNETMLRTYGCSYEEALKLDVVDFSHGEPPYSQADALAWIHKAAEEGPQVFEWHSRRRDGETFWAEAHLKSVIIGGEPRVLTAVRDITERKRAEAQAQQHLAELTRAWHANTLGELASGLAHELNQPLCAILNYSGGCLRLSRRKHFSIDTLRTSIEQIATQAERAASIIKRIRGLISKREPHRSDLDLDAILSDAVGMLETEISEQGVAAHLQRVPDLPRVRGDSVEIEQVVLNLMRNAIEAMSDATVTRRALTVSTRLLSDREVEVTVADTGRGLSAELAEKVFDSFFTTKAQGLGVGLALSRRIIDAHGGRLWVESDGHSGATFRFTLPVEGAVHGEGKPRSVRSR